MESISDLPILDETSEIKDLAEIYFKEMRIPKKSELDAFHLATTAKYSMDYIVTSDLVPFDIFLHKPTDIFIYLKKYG